MGIIADEDEILDLVDANQQVVGTITHATAYDIANLGGHFLRASNGFIINSKGQLWIPKRTAHKKIAPNGLDYSAGEHAQTGEPYVEAMLRGFEEELNIKVLADDLIFIGMATPRLDTPPYFAAHYLYFSDETPNYNNDDFVSYEWLEPKALLELLATGIPAKSMLGEAIDLVSAYTAQQ
jgi:isopentenyldiphosphate isomerase